jgi:hypothetical protein
MRITITASGGIPVTLCDHGREGPSGLTLVPIRKIDVLEFVQGDYAKPKNRGSTLHQLTFSVSKEHATHTAAQLYMLMMHTTIPATGELAIDLEDQTTHLVAREATVEMAPLPLLGVLTTIAFTIKFGEIDGPIQVLTQGGDQILTSDGNPIFVNQESL